MNVGECNVTSYLKKEELEEYLGKLLIFKKISKKSFLRIARKF